MSGLSRMPGKHVWVNTHRGFESRPFRQDPASGMACGACCGRASAWLLGVPAVFLVILYVFLH